MALEHRARLVGTLNQRDPRAGYALGVLALRGELADPDLADAELATNQSDRRHQAGLIYAAHRAIVYGAAATPRSVLGSLVVHADVEPDLLGDAERDGRAVRCAARLQIAVAAVCRGDRRRLAILDDVAVHGRWPATAEDRDALRGALAALARVFNVEPPGRAVTGYGR